MTKDKLTKAQVLAALRDVADNHGRMEAPGTDAEIVARWQALRDAGFVKVGNSSRYCLTEYGRTALGANDADR